MNIKKFFRLNDKEIRYITNTRNKFFLRGKITNINFIPQYPDKNYNKFAISVSSKFHKKAVYRNIIRRIFFDIIYKKGYLYKKIDWEFKKIYFSLKKWVDLDVKSDNFRSEVRKLLENDLEKLLKFKRK